MLPVRLAWCRSTIAALAAEGDLKVLLPHVKRISIAGVDALPRFRLRADVYRASALNSHVVASLRYLCHQL